MDIWLIILISLGGFAYLLGGIVYIIDSAFNENFLCKEYKDITTKAGFIIFLIIDIIMIPWTLMYCLFSGVSLLFEKIIFRKKD